MFECSTVSSAQFTVWRGSALECTSGISLRHGEFRGTGYANGTCNNGAIRAFITNIDITGSCYVSQMIVNTSLNLDGESIQCGFDTGTEEIVVDTITIRLIRGLIKHSK